MFCVWVVFALLTMYTLCSLKPCHAFEEYYLNDLFSASRLPLFSENPKRKKTKGQNIKNPETVLCSVKTRIHSN